MKRKAVLAVLFTGLVLAGCSPTYVEYDYDTDADFSAYRTFAWVSQESMSERAPQAIQMSSLMDSRIKRAVKDGMEAKGLEEASENPDLLLAYYVGVDNVTEIRRTGYGYGFEDNVRTDHFQEGTFILDMIDAKTNQLVWRGIAEGVLEERPTPDKVEKNVRDTVKKLLKKYPPAAQ